MAHLALRRIGVLAFQADSLFEVNQIKNFYLDKTGTLEAVESRFEPFQHIPLLEHYLSDLAQKSPHPILRGLKTLNPSTVIANLEEIPGSGVVAQTQDGHEIIVGRPSFLKSKNIQFPKHSGNLFPLVSYDGLIAGQIISKKTYDRRAKDFLQKLDFLLPGLQIEILSGDPHPEAGQSLLGSSGKIRYQGALSPEEKAQKIQERSAFVGDGLNDTLALAKADVSFLIGHRILGFAPVDFHIELPNINLVLATLNYAKKFRKVITETIVLAFIYNLIAVTLAFKGLFTPLGAALAMGLSFILLLASISRLLTPPEVPR
jgi:P-type E1-E2 ATPase